MKITALKLDDQPATMKNLQCKPIRSKAAITNLIKAQKILIKITEMYVSETKYPYSEEKHFFNSCYFSNFYSSFFLLLNLNRDFR